MIFGNINNLSEFPFLEEQVKECFEYAKTHDLASYEKGSHGKHIKIIWTSM